MIYQDIRSAFESTLYNIDTPFKTAWENTEFTPDTSAYQRVQLVFQQPDNPTMDAGFRREQGEFQVFVSYPLDSGVVAAFTKAKQIADVFKRGTTLTKNSTNVQIVKSPYVGTGFKILDRYVVPVTIEFYVDVFE